MHDNTIIILLMADIVGSKLCTNLVKLWL
uniref:Uncharacterized protein n=1 Tax=Anguilla anguilla TaxID=7936 RepID=A0A0E9VPX3_ANGAN